MKNRRMTEPNIKQGGKMNYIHHYASPLGGITLASDGVFLIGLWFDNQKYFAETIKGQVFKKNLPIFNETDKWLDIYFSGHAPNFTPFFKLDASPFYKRVWEILLTIDFGKTMTYGQIALQIAKEKGVSSLSAQAVGAAVGHNPVSLIIPCHRVIGANGRLTGYAAGLDKKAKLLELEQKAVRNL
jgi:methylated-DNA-[protein]-cysteine S-methyltransferase